jgi:hypothetical protein
VRQISEGRGISAKVVLAYIIYCLESYSPSPSHPVFVHWSRFSIPPEVMEKVGQALMKSGGLLGRLDVIQEQLEEEVLDEDLRIALIRWKMEKAVGLGYKPYDPYKVMTAMEAKERVERMDKEEKEGRGEEAKEEDEDDAMGQVEEVTTSGGQRLGLSSSFPSPICGPFSIPSSSSIVLPAAPPPLTASELIHHLCLNGGTSATALQFHFQCERSALEPLLHKLITAELVWKRGLLYCPS